MVLIEDGTICLRSSDPFYIVNYYIKWATTSWTHSSSVKDAHMWSIICNIICLSHSFIMPTVLKSKFSCFKEGTCATCSEQPYSLITMLRTLTYILTFKVEFLLICCIYKKNENITLLNSTAVLMCHFVRLSVPVEIVLLAFSLSHSRWFLLLFSAVLWTVWPCFHQKKNRTISSDSASATTWPSQYISLSLSLVFSLILNFTAMKNLSSSSVEESQMRDVSVLQYLSFFSLSLSPSFFLSVFSLI